MLNVDELVKETFSIGEQGQEQKQKLEWDSLQLSGNVFYDNFINAIRSEVTQYNYSFAIKKYICF